MSSRPNKLFYPLIHSPKPIPKLVWMIALIAAFIRVGMMLATHFTSEDFLITLRYAQNLSHGNGLVFNKGEYVLGTTTPLYTLFLAAAGWLDLPAALCGKLLNIAADSLLCPLLYRWVQALGGDVRTGVVAALCACLCPLQIDWAVSGMETGLVTLGCTLLWVLALEGELTLCYLLAAVVILIRWDALLVVFLITLQSWYTNRSFPVRQMLITTCILIPFLLAAWHWYGSPLPGTAFAKSRVYGWRADHIADPFLRRLPILPKLMHVFLGFPYGLPFTFTGILGLLSLWQKKSVHIIWPLIWVSFYWGSFLTSRILLFTWYLVPPLPLMYVLSAFGIAYILFPENRQYGAVPKMVIAGSLTIISCLCMAASFHVLRRDQLVEDTVRKPMGLWLQHHAAPGDTVMLEPIGYVGYYSKLRVLDVIGLVSPQVLPFYRPGAVYPPFDIAVAYHPEWCVLRPGELEEVRQAAKAAHAHWSNYYRLVKTFDLTPDTYVYYIFKRVGKWYLAK